MSLNNAMMLPDFVRSMEQMSDLLQAEEQELNVMTNTIKQEERELFICTAMVELPRYEEIFNLPSDLSLSIQDRRLRIITKMNTRTPATKGFLERAVFDLTGLRTTILEHFSEYRFTVTIHLSDRYILDIPAIRDYIRVLRPAHLDFSLITKAQVSVPTACVTAAVPSISKKYIIEVK